MLLVLFAIVCYLVRLFQMLQHPPFFLLETFWSGALNTDSCLCREAVAIIATFLRIAHTLLLCLCDFSNLLTMSYFTVASMYVGGKSIAYLLTSLHIRFRARASIFRLSHLDDRFTWSCCNNYYFQQFDRKCEIEYKQVYVTHFLVPFHEKVFGQSL